MNNSQINSYLQQLRLCSCNKKRVRRFVIYRSYPFAFEYTPQSLGRVKFRRIRWEIEKKQSSLFPHFSQFFYFPISVNGGIVQDNDRFLRYFEREYVKIVHNLICVNGFLCGKALVLIPFCNHAKYVESCGFL